MPLTSNTGVESCGPGLTLGSIQTGLSLLGVLLT